MTAGEFVKTLNKLFGKWDNDKDFIFTHDAELRMCVEEVSFQMSAREDYDYGVLNMEPEDDEVCRMYVSLHCNLCYLYSGCKDWDDIVSTVNEIKRLLKGIALSKWID